MKALPTISAKDALQKTEVSFLDLRSPSEFEDSQLPSSVNLPLLYDHERHEVGLCYAQKGEQKAIELGHQILSGDVKAERVQRWCQWANSVSDPVLFCWRGGLRSQNVQQALHEKGVVVPRVEGGYKAMRRVLVDLLEGTEWPSIKVISGPTGSGKTDLIKSLKYRVDLEGLARHRGSVFGAMSPTQPAQASFENSIAVELFFRLQHAFVWVEDEGKLIGRRHLPQLLKDRMNRADYVEVEECVETRAQRLIGDYLGVKPLSDTDIVQKQAEVLEQFDRIERRLGGLVHRKIRATIEDAFAHQQRSGEISEHEGWVAELLTKYYDPMYAYQNERKQGQLLFRGSYIDVQEFCCQSE